MEVVVLAAGKGTRMYSDLPKVLHPLAGKPLLQHVIDTARALNPRAIHIVYGYGGERVPQTLAAPDLNWVLQAQQLGTGHAVQQAAPQLNDDAIALVLYGDVPLTRAETLRGLIDAARSDALALLTIELPDPTGYGRIVRDSDGRVQAIVEHKDASATQRTISEVNTGILAAPAKALKGWLGGLSNDNAQREYYLTDIVGAAARQGYKMETAQPSAAWEVMGVNSKTQLAELERIAQVNRARAFTDQGVMLMDPARIDIRGALECGRDVVIDINCVFEGAVKLGDRVRIGPHCVVRDATIGADTVVNSHCVIEASSVGADCRVGPFARIRPDSVLDDHVHIGNFVEIKKSQLGEGAKANHLAYVGDSTVGKKVNIGAGVITVNYDGANKHRTVIGDNAFVGSDCQLIAPVNIGAGATVGAGSTITSDVPPDVLAVNRARDTKIVPGWKRPSKKVQK